MLAQLIVFLLAFAQINGASANENLASQSNLKEFSRSSKWLRLLHYKKQIFGSYKSEADGERFFFSPNGKTDPYAELISNIEAFASDKLFESSQEGLKLKAQCLYPYRYAVIKKELKLNIKDVECPEYNEFIKKINGDSITLVFSSYYAGAPASMFGHTFLKVNSSKNNSVNKNAILDYAVDFSARTGAENVFFQSVSGLIGLYKGLYSVWPYYIKVKEYNNAEHRDLIEYELNFTKEEVTNIISHLWELGNTYFDYYFFTENCSYQLLTLIEAVKDDWDLSGRFHTHVIPIDTVRAIIENQNSLKNVNFRPAISKKLFQRLDALNQDEYKQVDLILNSKKSANEIQNPIVAESVTHYLSMKQISQFGKLDNTDSQIQHNTLIRRSELSDYDENVLKPIQFKRPDEANNSARLWISMGTNQFGLFEELGFRPALYDILNSDKGYIQFSSIEFGSVKLKFSNKKKRIALSELSLLATHSINPYLKYGSKLSYYVEFSFKNPKDRGCYGCVVANTELNVGLAPKFGKYLRKNI